MYQESRKANKNAKNGTTFLKKSQTPPFPSWEISLFLNLS
jgi:hypothetical protein